MPLPAIQQEQVLKEYLIGLYEFCINW